jgi:hypothetical protein
MTAERMVAQAATRVKIKSNLFSMVSKIKKKRSSSMKKKEENKTKLSLGEIPF